LLWAFGLRALQILAGPRARPAACAPAPSRRSSVPRPLLWSLSVLYCLFMLFPILALCLANCGPTPGSCLSLQTIQTSLSVGLLPGLRALGLGPWALGFGPLGLGLWAFGLGPWGLGPWAFGPWAFGPWASDCRPTPGSCRPMGLSAFEPWALGLGPWAFRPLSLGLQAFGLWAWAFGPLGLGLRALGLGPVSCPHLVVC
jgi:hypothetical protein